MNEKSKYQQPLSFSEIIEEQKKDLNYKISVAVDVIAEGFELSKTMPAVAFSGGKDSTVLWHLIRTYFPDKQYAVIFGNTTVEFPESLKFARKLGKEWSSDKVKFYEVRPERLEEDGLKYEAQKEVLEWLIKEGRVNEVLKEDGKLKSTRTLEKATTPEMWKDFHRRDLVWKKGTLKHYFWCADQYGWPILGKAVSKLTARRINIDCFLRFSTSETEKEEVKEYYELLRHVKTSNHCCSVLKKEPSEKKQAELGVDVVFKGLMAEESHTRMLSFATRGYIYKSSRPHADEFYHISPLEIWTDDDIWTYIHKFNVPYSPLYDITYMDRNKNICFIKRNGCVGCATDIAFPDNHFSILRQTHPTLWKNYMKKGMAEQLQNLERYQSNGQIGILSFMDAVRVMDVRPCAFDEVGRRIRRNEITESEYDSEEVDVDEASKHEQMTLIEASKHEQMTL
jgi:3'-phosphoadenosine 5'-phosphosulfate sulfotransferase (PAPS reductase)/FAD synthetase